MDPKEEETTQAGPLDRLRKSWFPPTAVVGAFAAFVIAAFRVRPEPKPAVRPSRPSGAPDPFQPQAQPAPPKGGFERNYSRTTTLGSGTSAQVFRRSLVGIAVGSGDRIYALGDGEVRIFEPAGDFLRSLKMPDKASCLSVSPDGRIYVGAAGRVQIFDGSGKPAGGFASGEPDRPADITAIKLHDGEILVADAAVRFIRRYDASGRQLGVIGTQHKTGSFMLPNRFLDFDVDAGGVVRATDTGRHQVTAWALDGSPLGAFGKFGMKNPENFVGCCNPVNLALTPDGKIVTGEKMVARVKVYEPDGKLLALIGPENFDPMCQHIHLAVDSQGRILAADPVRREVKIFTQAAKVSKAESNSGSGSPFE